MSEEEAIVLDPAEVTKFNDLVKAARSLNQEPMEVLARWGRLRREREDGHAALVRLYRNLENLDIATLLNMYLNKDAGTAADGFRAVMLYLERYIDAKEKGQ